ncbi:class F sortase [Streptomyces sp. NPDC052040]|uniref:class F sortase n=1 Tax=Streptomyces sp. NPDC052040 TaxID=3365682 RepID=UPI0037D8A024
MTPSPQASKDRPSAASARLVSRALLWPAAAVALGGLLIHHSMAPPADPKPPTPPRAALQPPAGPPPAALSARPAPQGGSSSVLQSLARSAPKRLVIPQIGVDAPFTELSLDATGHLNPPPPNDRNLVGWYKNGASPGERGTAIVAGHVDTTTGPAVFVFLRLLKPGGIVDITRADGTTLRFQIDSVETFSKAHFPDQRVYADAPTPQLRLITCGGSYDHAAHEYLSNTVVFAHLITPAHSEDTATATPTPSAAPSGPMAPPRVPLLVPPTASARGPFVLRPTATPYGPFVARPTPHPQAPLPAPSASAGRPVPAAPRGPVKRSLPARPSARASHGTRTVPPPARPHAAHPAHPPRPAHPVRPKASPSHSKGPARTAHPSPAAPDGKKP